MAGVLSLFGYIIMIVGILCLGLAVYALVHRLVVPERPRLLFPAASIERGSQCESAQLGGVWATTG